MQRPNASSPARTSQRTRSKGLSKRGSISSGQVESVQYCLAGVSGHGIAIHQLLKNTSFDPDDRKRLVDAYEQTRNDPLTEMVAKKIIEIRQTGITDPAQISKLAIKQLGLP